MAILASRETTAREHPATGNGTAPRMEGAARERFAVTAKQGDRGCIVRLSGEVDTRAAPELTTTLQPWAENCRRLILDMREVTFMDSAGLRVILDLYRTLRAREVSLHLLEGDQGNVPRLLRHAGLEALIRHSEGEE